MTKKLFFVCLIIAVLIWGGCTPKQTDFIERSEPIQKNDQPSVGGELKLPIVRFETLNPIINDSRDVYYLNHLIYEGLVRLDDQYRAQSALAKSWRWSASEKQWIFDLREDVKWHDGSMFSASDVKFTIDVLKSSIGKVNESIYSQYVRHITNVEIINDNKVAIGLDNIENNSIEIFTFPIIPSNSYKNIKDVYEKETKLPAGTGPYKLQKYDRNNLIQLVPNSMYWGKQPNITSILFEIIPDEDAALTLLEANEISGAQTGILDWEKYNDNKSLEIHEYITQDYEFLGFNLNHPLLQDKNIRKALAYGIDRHEIIDRIYLGHATLTDVPISPDSWLYDEGYKKYGQDISKAKEFLARAGLDTQSITSQEVKVKDETKNGLELKLLVNEENPQRVQVAETIAAQLEEIGIQIIIDKASMEEYKRRIFSKKFDMVLAGWQFSDVFDLRFLLGSDYRNSTNFVGYQNPKMDSLLKDAATKVDSEYKKEIYQEVQDLFIKDLPFLSLYFKNNALIMHNSVKGRIEPRSYGIYNHIEDWYISNPKKT